MVGEMQMSGKKEDKVAAGAGGVGGERGGDGMEMNDSKYSNEEEKKQERKRNRNSEQKRKRAMKMRRL